jgi:hemoglobin/transferrin/lactoferrin receptor protein
MTFPRILVLCLLLTGRAFAQSGSAGIHVRDAESGNALPDVNISLPSLQRGGSTDAAGDCLLPGLPAGRVDAVVSHVGYRTARITIDIMAGRREEVRVELESEPVTAGAVTVSVTRWKQLRGKSPLPVAVIGASALAAMQEVTVSDVLATEAGIALQRDGIWASQVSIRGLGRSNVVTLIDGTRIETAANVAAGLSMIDMHDLERVEVIKGAASSLYGSGATGGVVNLISASSAYNDGLRIGGGISAGTASMNDLASGSVALRAGDEWWKASLRTALRSAGDARTPSGMLRSRFRDRNLSAAFTAIPAAGHELSARYQLYRAEDVGIPGGAPFPDLAVARYPYERRELIDAGYAVTGLVPELPRVDFDVSGQRIDRDVELEPAPGVTLRPHAVHRTLSARLQTQWLPGGGQQLTAGIDGWQRSYDGSRRREISSKDMVLTDLPVPASTYRCIGLYAQDRIPLAGERLSLTAGGRIDVIRVANEEARDPYSITVGGVENTAPPGQRVLWEAGVVHDISWGVNLGLLYNVTHELQLTLNAGRAFRSPSLEERFQYIQLGTVTYLGDPSLRSELSTTLDAGLRLHGEDVSLELNGFVNGMRNLVADRYVADTLYVTSNIGEALLYGGELTVSYRLPLKTVAEAGLSYVRGKNTGEGEDLPEIAPLGGRAGLRVSLNTLLSLHAGAEFAATQARTAPGEPRTPGYAVWEASLHAVLTETAAGVLRCTLGVRNIFDRPYRLHLSTYRGIVLDEPGRSVYARVSITW